MVHCRIEVLVAEMLDAGKPSGAGSVDAVLVSLAGLDEAVSGHDDGPRELAELELLHLPWPAKVAGQVGVLLEARVCVGRQHLAVGVDVDALFLGGLQDALQVGHVVARHQDGLALDRCGAHLHGCHLAELLVVAVVQDLQHAHVDLAHLKRQGQQLAQVLAVSRGQRVQGLVHKGKHGRVALAQAPCVVGVGSQPLEAVDDHLLHPGHALAQLLLAPLNPYGCRLSSKCLNTAGVGPVAGKDRHLGFDALGLAGSLVLRLKLVTILEGLVHVDGEAWAVEVDVREGGEQAVEGEHVDLLTGLHTHGAAQHGI
eukprot:comp22937_c0_seq1/m.36347 comp22937_c0_seq1/g.36347  ORF comp22937_c0_seq1/g.36347 comp22937_c0_seq1/m.36347 type:complete len:313 (+) comp22937_c0_seq1:1000-1938(+)